MGGYAAVVDDWELPASSSTEAKTLVLFGKAGNGKSATGNSILGRKAFKSKGSSSGVTNTCELQTTQLPDGQVLNVIDTPGIFDSSKGSFNIGKEITNCISLAKEGIHAILLVLSVRSCFSDEEAAALQSLTNLFGEEIINYMIVVFTCGDCLDEDEETLDDYLGNDCEQLKKVIQLCKNRLVLFDNKTKTESKMIEQVQKLMNVVNLVIMENGGRAYSNEIFEKMKKEAMKLHDLEEQVKLLKETSEKESYLKEIHSSYQEQLQKMSSEMVDLKLRECTLRLEMQLKEEHAARVKAEEVASVEIRMLREEQAARVKAEEVTSEEIRRLREEHAARVKAEEVAIAEICKLKENFKEVEREKEKFRKERDEKCAIL